MTAQRRWQDIDPADAVDLDLSKDLTITAPLNENGDRCPWPWEPQQLKGVPLGQYHCGYCLAMVVAGVEHLDYAGLNEMIDAEFKAQSRQFMDDNDELLRRLGE